MFETPNRVEIKTPRGNRREGQVVDADWRPSEHVELLTVDIDGTRLRVPAADAHPA